VLRRFHFRLNKSLLNNLKWQILWWIWAVSGGLLKLAGPVRHDPSLELNASVWCFEKGPSEPYTFVWTRPEIEGRRLVLPNKLAQPKTKALILPASPRSFQLCQCSFRSTEFNILAGKPCPRDPNPRIGWTTPFQQHYLFFFCKYLKEIYQTTRKIKD
jgi:hypothetical protein